MDCRILVQLIDIEMNMGESIYRDSCYNHINYDQVLSRGSACICVCDNLKKKHDLIYDNRHTYVKIVKFVNM